MDSSFNAHAKAVITSLRAALAKNKYDAAVIHAGTRAYYAFDDQEVPFKSLPHFARLVPTPEAEHLLVIDASSARVVLVHPDDYWLERAEDEGFWQGEYEVRVSKSADDAWALAKPAGRTAYIGDDAWAARVKNAGVDATCINDAKLIAELDHDRSVKTPYELECIEEANRRAAPGHAAAKTAFMTGASEFEILNAFLTASSAIEHDLSYVPIIALNEKGATLHYQHKRLEPHNGDSFLVDAGVSYRGYASDITRTYASPSADPRFAALITDVDSMQRALVDMVKPGVQFIELHHECHMRLASLLKKHGLTNIDGETAIETKVTRAFLPHGLGHMLGLQVHDVGNRSSEGSEHPLTKLYPHLRTNLRLAENMVTTIEPGVYFIDLLLNPHRSAETAKHFNWPLIDELKKYGGIRVEDNIVVTPAGPKNLTRPYVP